jgi:acetyl esterase/lipase
MSKYNIHTDFALLRFFPNPKKWMVPVFNALFKWHFKSIKAPKGIELGSHKIKGFDSGEIEILVFKPKNIEANAPCLVYYHGGGFFFEAVAAHKLAMFEYAGKANCVIVFPHYRVSLNGPFPSSLEDCYASLKWTNDHAALLGIDPNRIAIGGDSAGGNLAACIAQMALDRREVKANFQFLVYPVCDHRMGTASMQTFHDTPLCNTPSTQLMWDVYLSGVDRSKMPPYVSTLQRANLAGLPPAYIETAEFDCLRDEAILYAKRLQEAGIEVELNQTTGTIHAYDIIKSSDITQKNMERRVAALRMTFHCLEPSPKLPR